MTSRTKTELAQSLDGIFDSGNEQIDTMDKARLLRRRMTQNLAFELDGYMDHKIISVVSASVRAVVMPIVPPPPPADPAADIPGLRTLGFVGNKAMPGVVPLFGDLTGLLPVPTVVGLQGNSVLATTPATNEVLTWNGTAWAPAASAGGAPTGAAGGDLSGTYPNPTVAKIQGRTVSSAAPATNDVLTWDGSQWEPAPASGGGAAGGDLTGTYPNPTVAKIQGRTVASTAPATNDVLGWDGTQWEPTTPAVPVRRILWEMPIDVASVGTPVYIRTTADTPASPVGTGPTETVVPAVSFIANDALQLAANVGGGYIWPLNHGLTLPDEGYALEVWVSDVTELYYFGLICPCIDFTGSTAEGLIVPIYGNASNTDIYSLAIASSTYARVGALAASGAGWLSFLNPANLAKGPGKMLLEVRRNRVSASETNWRITMECAAPGGNSKTYVENSSVSTATAEIDGNYLLEPALGVWVDYITAYDVQLTIEKLRIMTL